LPRLDAGVRDHLEPVGALDGQQHDMPHPDRACGLHRRGDVATDVADLRGTQQEHGLHAGEGR